MKAEVPEGATVTSTWTSDKPSSIHVSDKQPTNKESKMELGKRKLFTKLFWLDATERLIATFVETLSAVVAVTVVAGGGFEVVNWAASLSASGLATLLSLLKSVYAAAKADTDTASLTVDTKELR